MNRILETLSNFLFKASLWHPHLTGVFYCVLVMLSYRLCIVSVVHLIGLNPESYEQRIRDSWIWKEMHKVRNIRPSFNSSLGMYGGLLYTGTVWYLMQGREPWTFHMHSDEGLFFYWQLFKPITSSFKVVTL